MRRRPPSNPSSGVAEGVGSAVASSCQRPRSPCGQGRHTSEFCSGAAPYVGLLSVDCGAASVEATWLFVKYDGFAHPHLQMLVGMTGMEFSYNTVDNWSGQSLSYDRRSGRKGEGSWQRRIRA